MINKLIQIEEIENTLLNIVFENKNKIFKGLVIYKYNDWNVFIELKENDSFSNIIRFELFLYNLSGHTKYHDIRQHYFKDDTIGNLEIFKKKCIELLHETFNSEIRKYKINKIILK